MHSELQTVAKCALLSNSRKGQSSLSWLNNRRNFKRRIFEPARSLLTNKLSLIFRSGGFHSPVCITSRETKFPFLWLRCDSGDREGNLLHLNFRDQQDDLKVYKVLLIAKLTMDCSGVPCSSNFFPPLSHWKREDKEFLGESFERH